MCAERSRDRPTLTKNKQARGFKTDEDRGLAELNPQATTRPRERDEPSDVVSSDPPARSGAP